MDSEGSHLFPLFPTDSLFSKTFAQCNHWKPRGPKDWKKSRFRSGIETFKRPISDWNFQSRLKFSTEIENRAPVVGNYQGRDWNFQSRWKLSIEIEIFNPGLKLSSVWFENFTRSIGIEFFQSQGPLGNPSDSVQSLSATDWRPQPQNFWFLLGQLRHAKKIKGRLWQCQPTCHPHLPQIEMQTLLKLDVNIYHWAL